MRRGEEHHIEAKVVDKDLEKQELQKAKAMGLENSNLEVVSQGKEVKVLEQEARGKVTPSPIPNSKRRNPRVQAKRFFRLLLYHVCSVRSMTSLLVIYRRGGCWSR